MSRDRESAGREAARRHLSARLLLLIALALLAPTATSILVTREVITDLTRGADRAQRSYQNLEVAARGSLDGVDRLLGLGAIPVASALARHLEYVVGREPELAREGDRDLSEHPAIRGVLSAQSLGANTRVGLFDAQNRMLAHLICEPGSALAACMPVVAKLVGDPSIAAQIVRPGMGRPGLGDAHRREIAQREYELPGQDGRSTRWIAVVTPIAGAPWRLGIEAPPSDVFGVVRTDLQGALARTSADLQAVEGLVAGAQRRLGLALLAGAVVVVGALVGIAWWIQRRVVRPLAHLKAVAERIRTGDLEVRAALQTEDEVEALADSMNFMLSQWAANYRGLVAANEALRVQLHERAQDLSTVLARLNTPGSVGELAEGAIFEERYRIERPLGNGGMGWVYAVRRVADGERLALKVLTKGERDPTAMARFVREAQIACSVRDPCLVVVLDVGISSDGRLFLVMEHADLGSLEQRRAQFGELAFGLFVLAQVARGLGALHRAGIVHQDLKPGNVLLHGDPHRPVVRIADFGISSVRDHTQSAAFLVSGVASTARADPGRLTATGALLGTPLYMAPELFVGGAAAASADLFSFGVLAYELLCGQGPWPEGRSPLLARLRGEPLAAPRELPAAVPSPLRALLERCLSTDPALRPEVADFETFFV